MWYYYKDSNVDQWNRIERPEGNPYINGQLIFNKGVKTIQWGKNFSTNSAGIIGYPHAKKKNLDPYLIPYKKINSKWITELNEKA